MKTTCKIQWINEKGQATPDCNDAVAIACITFFNRSGENIGQKRYPICQDHLDKMPKKPNYLNGVKISEWSVERLEDDN